MIHVCSGAHTRLDQLADSVELRFGIDRADVGVLVEWITDTKHVDAVLELRDEHVGDRFLNQQSASGAADVALVEENSVDDAFNRLIDWRIIEDDVRGFTSKLQRQLLVASRQLPHDDFSHFSRAGKSNLRGSRMGYYRGSCLTGAADNVHHSRRQIRLQQQLR